MLTVAANKLFALTLRRVNFLVFDEDLALQQLGTRQRDVAGQLDKRDKHTDSVYTSTQRRNRVRDFAR